MTQVYLQKSIGINHVYHPLSFARKISPQDCEEKYLTKKRVNMYYILGLVILIVGAVYGFQPKFARGRVISSGKLMMSSLAPPDLNLAALPTVEEWLDVCDPQLKKVTTAMFRAVKEISYKVSNPVDLHVLLDPFFLERSCHCIPRFQ